MILITIKVCIFKNKNGYGLINEKHQERQIVTLLITQNQSEKAGEMYATAELAL